MTEFKRNKVIEKQLLDEYHRIKKELDNASIPINQYFLNIGANISHKEPTEDEFIRLLSSIKAWQNIIEKMNKHRKSI